MSHLCLNWNDDTYVFRQSVNWDGRKTNDNKDHKPPQALPSGVARNIRYVRLLITLMLLIFESVKCIDRDCAKNVSYAAHGFGALSGFIMGIIFLRARFLRPIEKKLKYFLLLIAYGLPLSYILIQYFRKFRRYSTEPLSNCPLVYWSNYEDVCQDTCYRRKSTILVEACEEMFSIHKKCGNGLITFNNTSINQC